MMETVAQKRANIWLQETLIPLLESGVDSRTWDLVVRGAYWRI